jgi:ArsR family transcriptional regulator
MTSATIGSRAGVRAWSPAPHRGHGIASVDARVHLLPHVVRTLKAIAHPARLRMLGMLTTGELCVCQMTAVLDLAVSTVSGHLADLRAAGLVTERKDGKWVHYRLADAPGIQAITRSALALLAADDQAGTDAAVVRQVRCVPVETLSGGRFDVAAAKRRARACSRPGALTRRRPGASRSAG